MLRFFLSNTLKRTLSAALETPKLMFAGKASFSVPKVQDGISVSLLTAVLSKNFVAIQS